MIRILKIDIGKVHENAGKLRGIFRTFWPENVNFYTKVGLHETFVIFVEKDKGLIYPVLESLVLQRPLPEYIGAIKIRAREVFGLEFENRMSEIMEL